MKLKPAFLYFFIFPFFLQACLHTKNTCNELHWNELGRQDSIKAITKIKSFKKRQATCSVDFNSIYAKAYNSGFDLGLKEYCHFKTAYIYGLSQIQKDISVCPVDLQKEFIKTYAFALHVKTIQTLQSDLQNRIQKLHNILYRNNKLFILDNK